MVIEIIEHMNKQGYQEQYQLGSSSCNFYSQKYIIIDEKDVDQERLKQNFTLMMFPVLEPPQKMLNKLFQ